MNKFQLPPQKNSILLGLIGIGLITFLCAFYLNPERAWAALLVLAFFLLISSLSGSFFTALQFVSGATWSVVIRRVSEMTVSVLPFTIILFLVILFWGMDHLYEWVHYFHCKASGNCAGFAEDHILDSKAGFLNLPFFIGRVIFYLIVFYLLGMMLLRSSLRQDKAKGKQDTQNSVNTNKKMITLSSIYLVGFAYFFLMASLDILMSLEPHWYSTMFVLYTFSGLAYSGISILIIFIFQIQKNGGLKQVTVEHYHDLGKFLFLFTIFWAYIAFCQFMLIWYANLPEETVYLEKRLGMNKENSDWGMFTMIFWIAHFVIPFFILLFREIKRNPSRLHGLAWYCLFMGFCDVIWMAYGGIHHLEGFPVSWIELGAFLGGVGFFGYIYFQNFAKVNEVPIGDPNLEESLKFHQIY